MRCTSKCPKLVPFVGRLPGPHTHTLSLARGRAHIWGPGWCLLAKQRAQLWLSVHTVGHPDQMLDGHFLI